MAREQWESSGGFVLATIGAAVGLGNIWRFSYIAGENGGGAFLLVYLFFVLVVGFPLMIAEISLGRRNAADAISAYEAPGISGAWRRIGWLGVISAVLILGYYAVIAGWALKYFAGALTGDLWTSARTGYGQYFDDFISSAVEPVVWQAIMLTLTSVVVARGIKGGIERLNRLLMPALAAIVIGIGVYAVTLPGSGSGVAFLLAPDWSTLGSPAVYLNALGQAFFSLGIGVAVFVTYGSYLGAQTRIPAMAFAVTIGDTVFAVAAGIAIFATVFALGGDPAAGPKLAFITLPQILLQIPAGNWIGIAFFFLLSAAALTSMVALLEVPVACLSSRLGWSRQRAAATMGLLCFVLGLPAALGYGPLSGFQPYGMALLDLIDHVVSNLFLPVSGLLIALLVGWHLDRKLAAQAADLDDRFAAETWLWSLRLLAPAAIIVVLLRSSGLL
ncbi:MAG: sodium-dependent transporter [Rhizobiales bacterium]|nr:sodium-dependent transporter [Hyphomicrobiales bacterium]